MIRASRSFLALAAFLAGAVPACGGTAEEPTQSAESELRVVCSPEACNYDPNMICKVVAGTAVCIPYTPPPPPP
jgi:hypothetical protein